MGRILTLLAITLISLAPSLHAETQKPLRRVFCGSAFSPFAPPASLAKDLQDPDPEVRRKALHLLAKPPDDSKPSKKALAAIEGFLDDPSPMVAETASYLLEQHLDQKSVLELFRRSRISTQEQILRFSEAGPKGSLPFTPKDAPALLSLLDSSDSFVRFTSLLKLRALDSVPATKSLLKHLQKRPGKDDFFGNEFAIVASDLLQKKGYLKNRTLKQLADDLNSPARAGVAFFELFRRKSPEANALLHDFVNSKPDSPMQPHVAQTLLLRGEEPRNHILYRSQKDNPRFFDPKGPIEIADFAKNGSETFLLGGPLAGKVIARSIKADQRQAWKKALTASAFWKKAGFSHVPIEPFWSLAEISQKFRLDPTSVQKLQALEKQEKAKGNVLAFAKVLQGPDVDQVFRHPGLADTGIFGPASRLKSEVTRISQLLGKLGVHHGHPHTANFVVHGDEATGEPVLYMIDFDAARASPTLRERLQKTLSTPFLKNR